MHVPPNLYIHLYSQEKTKMMTHTGSTDIKRIERIHSNEDGVDFVRSRDVPALFLILRCCLPQIHSVLVCHPYSQQVTFVSYVSKDSPFCVMVRVPSLWRVRKSASFHVSTAPPPPLESSCLVSASCHDKEIDYNHEEKIPTYHSEESPTRE